MKAWLLAQIAKERAAKAGIGQPAPVEQLSPERLAA
jgi:hypothetical protein